MKNILEIFCFNFEYLKIINIFVNHSGDRPGKKPETTNGYNFDK